MGETRAETDSWDHAVRAVNTATTSTNKIHDDEVASQFGFRGGLVPGVDVYAYLTVPPARQWGLDWLRNGAISARFSSPVYDGDLVSVEGTAEGDATVELRLLDHAGSLCASAVARRTVDAGVPDPRDWPAGDEAARGRPASPSSLAPGTALVPVAAGFHADRAGEYLAEVGEELPLYERERIAHPGWLLRFANTVLAQHVRLGPWIHVSSDVTFLDLVHDGERVETRAVVADEFERKGHRFVELDVLITAADRAVQRIVHTAIHTPRPPG